MSGLLRNYNELLRHAAEDPDEGRNIPNVAVVAADSKGNVIHSAAYGSYMPLDAEVVERQKFTADTVCWIASCTKLMTAVAALQCVERRLLRLDTDITDVLPELKNIDILLKMVDDGSGSEKPLLKKSEGTITLSNLLTHSSGLSYEMFHPRIMAWSKWIDTQYRSGAIPPPTSAVTRMFLRPLLHEPDQGWAYGYGTDWAGIAVSRVSGISLEEFMRRNIWGPLGMNSTTFYPRATPALLRRTASLVERDRNGRLRALHPNHRFAKLPDDMYPEGGGGGCYGTANDFIKLLTSLLRNDGKLLKPETVDMMFSPQLKDPIHLRTARVNPPSFILAGNIPLQTPVDYGFGGILNGEDIPTTGRSKGSMQWGGLPNLTWWINPRDGVCGCYWSQLLPQGDPQSVRLHDGFEKAVLDSLKEKKFGSGKL